MSSGLSKGIHDDPRLLTTTRSEEYRLGDLIATDELGLELVSGDASCRVRAIAGAQTSEIVQPTRYLDRNWVLLMTGVGLSDHPDDQRALIAELEAADITALGFAVDIVHAEVPAVLVEEARRRSFPIFTVPREVAFRDVVSTVHRHVWSKEMLAAHRLTAMQRYLMDALGEADPAAAIIDRLETLVDARVGLLRRSGQFALSSAALPGEEILEQVRDRSGDTVHFDVGRYRGLALPIEGPAAADRTWLVIATDSRQRLHALAQAAAQVARPVLVAVTRLAQKDLDLRRLTRRSLLDTLLDPDDRRSARLAASQAKDHGFTITDGAAVVIVSQSKSRGPSEKLLLEVESRLTEADIPPLATICRDEVCAILPAEFIGEELYRSLSEVTAVRICVGRTVIHPLELGQSLADAQLALHHAVRTGSAGIVSYEALSFDEVMLNELSSQRLAPKLAKWLAPLYANVTLCDTVRAYFSSQLDVMRAAEALSVHPNSVRYRLKRVEEIIGATLMDPATITALHVALLAHDEEL